ncbi:MAG: hypothetical protein ACKVPY_14985 [Paracoccaceae bacterium]
MCYRKLNFLELSLPKRFHRKDLGMAKSALVFDESHLRSAQEKESSARLARYLEGVDGLVAMRKGLAEKLVRDPSLKGHVAEAAQLSEARGKGMEKAAKGDTSRAKVLRKLARNWDSTFSESARDRLAEAYYRAGGAIRSGEKDWLTHAFDRGDRPPKAWDGRYSDLGWEHLHPHAPPPDDTGTVQQGLMDPITLCVGPPYAFQSTASTTSGVAVVSASPMATPSSGRLFLLSSTVAPVLAGGGSDSSALVGSDISWPAGFDTLTVTVDINLTSSLLFAIAIFGGAGASASLVLRVTMSDGRTFSAQEALGSAVAPLLWHTSITQSGQHQFSSAGIPLTGKAGTARLMAGVHDNTAAVGVGGSSGADSIQAATVTKICAAIS